jgi:LAS superfamily LD-carboxypeptidase LdcB
MLMVGYMRWVHKRSIAFVVAVLLPAVIGVGFLSSNNEKPIVENSTTPLTPTIQCFDLESLLVLTTTEVSCPNEFTFLGDGPLTESRTATDEVTELHPLLSARFAVAQSFARADGVVLTLTSGFRSLERQQMLFDREVAIRGSETEAAKWVLPPQYSHHPQGLAIDVNYPGDKAGALWLEKNGSRFGLCRVYANEWWHFEGVIAPGERCPAMAANALVDLE